MNTILKTVVPLLIAACSSTPVQSPVMQKNAWKAIAYRDNRDADTGREQLYDVKAMDGTPFVLYRSHVKYLSHQHPPKEALYTAKGELLIPKAEQWILAMGKDRAIACELQGCSQPIGCVQKICRTIDLNAKTRTPLEYVKVDVMNRSSPKVFGETYSSPDAVIGYRVTSQPGVYDLVALDSNLNIINEVKGVSGFQFWAEPNIYYAHFPNGMGQPVDIRLNRVAAPPPVVQVLSENQIAQAAQKQERQRYLVACMAYAKQNNQWIMGDDCAIEADLAAGYDYLLASPTVQSEKLGIAVAKVRSGVLAGGYNWGPLNQKYERLQKEEKEAKQKALADAWVREQAQKKAKDEYAARQATAEFWKNITSGRGACGEQACMPQDSTIMNAIKSMNERARIRNLGTITRDNLGNAVYH